MWARFLSRLAVEYNIAKKKTIVLVHEAHAAFLDGVAPLSNK